MNKSEIRENPKSIIKEAVNTITLCPYCTEKIQLDLAECPHCKSSLTENTKHLKECPWCNKNVNAEATECQHCHSLLFEEKGTVSNRLSRIKDYNYGQILLREKEYLFTEIYEEQNLDEQIKFFALNSLVFSMAYGFFLGFFAGGWQIIASTIKLPLVLFGTLIICLPALFTFNMLLGSKLSFKQTLSTLLIANYMMSVILVSFAPILFFFTVSTDSRGFFAILNIGFCVIAGGFGISLLWRGMKFLTLKSGYEPNILLLRIWSLIYMFVGTQFAYILRPFIGIKEHFVFFRHLEGNFYGYLYKVWESLF